MQTSLPDDALLARYAVTDDGEALPHYTDCFTTQIEHSVNLTAYVRAFYTTPLFRCERFILRLLGMGSSDDDIDALLAGQQTHFAAWTQEDRSDDQLLMCDIHARTRSWFRVVPEVSGTRLYFGSAVVIDGEQMRAPFRAMIPMHRFYSRQLLRAATRRLKARQATH
ncbi:MAG: hypothetical protein AAGA44_13745 [Pseudomonadota bacterium]